MQERERGFLFDIQRFCIHDGPGIRTLVFMKTCWLRCIWCSNPESQNSYPEIRFNMSRCLGLTECGLCKQVCNRGAILEVERSQVFIDRDVCDNCGNCAEVCPSGALKVVGAYFSIDEVLRIVESEQDFYRRSGGGITIGGGDPICQAEFVSELLRTCRTRGLHTVLETAGHGRWEDLYMICRNADLVYYDIKHMNSSKHKESTGASNELILQNLERLSKTVPDVSIIVRTPIIPGFNDSVYDVRTIAEFVAMLENVRDHELVPFHQFGKSKYQQLGREYLLCHLQPPPEKIMKQLRCVVTQVLTRCRGSR